jgi:hypothetical protein
MEKMSEIVIPLCDPSCLGVFVAKIDAREETMPQRL